MDLDLGGVLFEVIGFDGFRELRSPNNNLHNKSMFASPLPPLSWQPQKAKAKAFKE